MFCTSCGAKVADDGQFCPNCGHAMNPGVVSLPTVSMNGNIHAHTERLSATRTVGVMIGRVIGGDMLTIILGFSDGSTANVERSNIGFPVANGDMLDIYTSPDGTKRYAPHETMMMRTPGNRVNKIVYILLAVLLGGIGAHKFYCGKNGIGILYLVFCWTGIPEIAGLIEGILAIGKPNDAQGNIEIP